MSLDSILLPFCFVFTKGITRAQVLESSQSSDLPRFSQEANHGHTFQAKTVYSEFSLFTCTPASFPVKLCVCLKKTQTTSCPFRTVFRVISSVSTTKQTCSVNIYGKWQVAV